MLKLLKSGFSAGGRERIKDGIRAVTARGRRALLIVPEQETVVAEGELCRELPPDAPLYFEVTNFTRFANTVFRALGGVSGEYCDRGKRGLIMWRTLAELAPVLSMTAGRREISSGLVDRALAAVTELEGLGITAAELEERTEDGEVADDARLVGKMKDLSMITSLYKRLLTEKYADAASDAEAMLTRLSENPDFLRDTDIFVDGFTSFTESQYRLLGALSARGEVTVHLIIPKSRPEAFEYEEVRGAESRLKNSARRAGADVQVKHEDGRQGTSCESLSRICDLLFVTDTDEVIETGDELRIFEAYTPFEECDFIAADIRRRVMQEKASYSDFAIVARSAERYARILDTALARAKVPAFTSFPRDITEFEAIKLISTAFSCVNRGFAREDVITYAKCGLSGISREACDEFEMYVNLWQINGRGFSDGSIWSMNPLGYSTRRPEGTDARLKRINEVRSAIVEPLISLKASLSEAVTVVEHARALYEFLSGIGLENGLKERVRVLDALGEHEAAEENSRLWKIIVESLDSIVEVMGDSKTDAEGFPRQLEVLFRNAAISRIPQFTDAVTVGSADMIRLYGKKHVYMIGVEEGQFLATVSDSSYFSEKDKERLSRTGLAVRPELATKSARELFIFARSFSYAKESVTLTYSACNARFKHISRAAEIYRIIKLTGGKVQPVRVAELSAKDRLWHSEAAIESLGELTGDERIAVREALCRAGLEHEVDISEGDIENGSLALGESIIKEAYSGNMSLTQTMIDRYVGCPLDYFCRFTVKLAPEDRAVFDARGIGSFIHAILESFFKAVRERGIRAGELSAEEREAMTLTAAKEYIASLGDGGRESEAKTRIKLKRLCRAAVPVVNSLCKELGSSEFEPRFFELEIRRGGAGPEPVSFSTEDAGNVLVYGTIDRVDSYKRGDDVYLKVVDYKTGSKSFKPEDLSEGRNLQMFLYLKAMIDSKNQKFRESIGQSGNGRILPAGVIYVRTSVDDVKLKAPDDSLETKALEEAQERSGMVLDDEEIISAMGTRYTPVGTKDGQIAPKTEHLRYDEEGWEKLMKTVEESVITVARGIRSGSACATPSTSGGHSSCEWCEYKPICRKVRIK